MCVCVVLGDEGWLARPWRFDTKPWVYDKVRGSFKAIYM